MRGTSHRLSIISTTALHCLYGLILGCIRYSDWEADFSIIIILYTLTATNKILNLQNVSFISNIESLHSLNNISFSSNPPQATSQPFHGPRTPRGGQHNSEAGHTIRPKSDHHTGRGVCLGELDWPSPNWDVYRLHWGRQVCQQLGFCFSGWLPVIQFWLYLESHSWLSTDTSKISFSLKKMKG